MGEQTDRSGVLPSLHVTDIVYRFFLPAKRDHSDGTRGGQQPPTHTFKLGLVKRPSQTAHRQQHQADEVYAGQEPVD